MKSSHLIASDRGAADARENADRFLADLSEASDPEALVQAIAPYDLLIAWRLGDDEQRAELLKLADKEQVDLMMDLICWRSDVPDLGAIERFIKPLVLSGLDGASETLTKLEPELRTLLLKRSAVIHLLENRNDDIPAQEGSELMSSPDGLYYVEFPESSSVSDVERALYEALFTWPFEKYHLELECIRHDFAPELEETALRFRAGRMGDQGFASQDEALSLLAARTPEEVRDIASAALPDVRFKETEILLPVLYGQNLEGHEFLRDAVDALFESDDPKMRDRAKGLGATLAATVNRYLSATKADIGDIDSVSVGVKETREIIALGLWKSSEGDVQKAANLLGAVHPTLFVQVGLGLIYPLRDRARKLRSDPKLAFEDLFEQPYRSIVNCLSQNIPRRWPALDEGQDLNPFLPDPLQRDLFAFGRIKEVEYAEKLLAEAEEIPQLLFDALGWPAPLPFVAPASVLLLNALANSKCGRKPKPAPLSDDEAQRFGQEALAANGDDFASEAIRFFASLARIDADDPFLMLKSEDPFDRALARLVLLGAARLASDDPLRALSIRSAKIRP